MVLLWLAAFALAGAAISYARDIELVRRGMEWIDRDSYRHDGDRIVDQWWGNQLYTTHVTAWGEVKVNTISLGLQQSLQLRDDEDIAWYARMWVDAQKGPVT